MRYLSTRGGVEPVTSSAAILQGLASDGGLFVPESFPAYFPEDLAQLSYQELAEKIFSLYLTDYTPEEIKQITADAYSLQAFPKGPAPCVGLGDNITVLELWHGPTSAFKDLALQALPRLMSVARRHQNLQEELAILVATSGDTGKAALEGFKDVDGTRIIVFYPAGGVSPIQELQMVTTGGNNTAVIGVNGNFDNCQTGVKSIFSTAHDIRFSSANSINWGRLLPQIVYYYYAYGQMEAAGRIRHGEPIDVCVPTGNFGNILAGCYGALMGLPVGNFLCASNENNVLTQALNEGYYNSRRPFYKTISPSMDILVSSNFERFVYLHSGNDPEYTRNIFNQLKEEGAYTLSEQIRSAWDGKMGAAYADQEQAKAAIGQVWKEHNYVLDPHTAVGYAAIQQKAASGNQMLLVSTASPYKFPAAVLEALGVDITDRDEMELPALLENTTGWAIPANLLNLDKMERRHDLVVDIPDMEKAVRNLLGK